MSVHAPATDLRRLMREVLEATGVAQGAAQTTAEVLLYADLHGFTTHGAVGLSTIYVPRLLDGRIDCAAQARIVHDTGACAVMDGQRALGHPTMVSATDLAISRARRHGIAMVVVHRSSHFGSAGYYARRAAAVGMVALSMTNCGEQGVAPPLGGSTRMLGTNPIAAAVPAPGGPPFVLDMSTTTVASGKVRAARFADTDVPTGWLHDRAGRPETDPNAFFEGRAELNWLGGDLTAGGAKGYGLAVLVDLLCGPLAGAGFGPHAPSGPAGPSERSQATVLDAVLDSEDDPQGRGIGHTVIVIDPAAFGATDRLATDARELLDALVADAPIDPDQPVTYPGAPDEALARTARVNGVTLPDHVLDELLTVAKQLGVSVPASFTSEEAA